MFYNADKAPYGAKPYTVTRTAIKAARPHAVPFKRSSQRYCNTFETSQQMI